MKNVFCLPDLIDLAITTPENGRVNFNIIHVILHTIVKELKLEEIRPYFHLNNPELMKSALKDIKLKEASTKRSLSHESENLPSSIGLGKTASADSVNVESDKTRQENSLPKTVDGTEIISSGEKSEESLQPTKNVSESTIITKAFEEGFNRQGFNRQDSIVKDVASQEFPKKDEQLQKRTTHKTGEAVKYINLEHRVQAAEEYIYQLTKTTDHLNEKIKKLERRNAGIGPSTDELEAIDDRITELEERVSKLEEDHDILMELQRNVNSMLTEFEAIKALASQMEQMKKEISLKADREETEAALASKGDLDFVNTKVDQVEFETALEELGEAIGLLGLKFTKKNEEWNDRATEIWQGINCKMQRDIFDTEMINVRSRLTALMDSLRKIKKVLEELVYPDSAGVTRCILCRRPACIGGQDCLSSSTSPKRPLSDKSSDSDDPKRAKEILGDVLIKKQKLTAPPYSQSRDTILSFPYSSSSYKTTIDDNNLSKFSKLPAIKTGKKELRLDDLEKNKEKTRSDDKEKDHLTVDGISCQTEIFVPMHPSSSSPSSSNLLMSDNIKNLEDFAPTRLMSDVFRRDILPKKSSNQKSSEIKQSATNNKNQKISFKVLRPPK